MKNIICSLLVLFFFCGCSTKRKISQPKSYKEIISLYTNEYQSVKAPVVVRFVKDSLITDQDNIPSNLFTIEPYVEGKLQWNDNNTLKFVPNKVLKSNQEYTVSIDLRKIIPNISDSLQEFNFQFSTKKQSFQLTKTFLNPINTDFFSLTGKVITTDYISLMDLKEIVRASVGEEEYKITWFPNSISNQTRYTYKIDSIERGLDSEILTLEVDANPIGLNINTDTKVSIPALGDFKLVDVKVTQEYSQEIKLIFSDFIDEHQSIEGLIRTNKKNCTITINENYALLNFKKFVEGKVLIDIEKGLLNKKKHRLQASVQEEVEFKPISPGVRSIDTRTILPYGKILPFSFETVNLDAVDVRVTKVLQKNMLQFLQRNELDNSYRLHYVGEEIITKKVKLNTNKNLKLWNKQVVDLKSMIQKDPSALYHIEVGFRKSYAQYPCKTTDNINNPSTLGLSDNVKITEKNFWEQHDKGNSYDWDQRNNPCHPMFYTISGYNSNASFSTNILGSNLGVITKEEKDGDLLVVVTSLKTTNPLPNTKVEFYNYQNRKLKTAYTNSEGIVKIKSIGSPFLVVASYGNQRGYLKLRDSESLSLSQFDVDGTSIATDIKGLLYAERGVWRPGDSIYVNLILEDKKHNFPKDYPIGFEFTNPKGQVIERRTVVKGLNGHYKFWTKTSLEAVTGDYLVTAYVGSSTFRKSIKIQTIRPNRLKINLDLGDEKSICADSVFTTKINTKWLHGASGSGLRHKIDVVFNKSYTSFPGYDNYNFVAPYRDFKTLDYVFMDENTNADGEINSIGKFEYVKNAPGFLRADFKIKAFEKGGRFSIDKISKIVHPFQSYVGIKNNYVNRYHMDDVATFDLVNLTRHGKVKEDTLIVTLYKLKYNWWYNLNNDKYVYQGEMNKEALRSDTLATVKGYLKHKLIFNNSLDDGRYLLIVKNSEGHQTGKVVSFYSSKGYTETVVETKGTKKLELSTESKVCKVGESIKITVPTAGRGRVLLSIEDGQDILKTKWLTVTGNSTTYRFTAMDKMSPYVYIHAMYIQPHKHSSNDLPLRMYGVLPIKVESKNAYLEPVIAMKKELRPKKDFTINIKEKKGLPMTYTLAIVDEGLLDITHYRMPKVYENFNQKPALEVMTWDVFDRVIAAERFNTKNLLSLGGDGSEAPPEGVKLNRFKPMVKFIGPFYCAAGKSINHKMTMPNYVGSVKVMVIAGHNGAYGKASHKVEVKEPLMILGTMPRVLGPMEEIKLPIDVFAMKDYVKNVIVSIETNDLLNVVGVRSKKIEFKKIGEKQLFFDLEVNEKFGEAKVKLIAKCGKLTSTYDVSLNVRAHNVKRTISKCHIIPINTVYQEDVKAFGYKTTNKVTAELSAIPAINLQKRMNYLVRYPYGCVEQTTSSVFPQLYLTTLMDLDKKQKREIEQNVKAGIERLERFQTYDGGFSYWPGGNESHSWGSNYAGNFLMEAQEKGFYVNEELMKKWMDYQTKQSNRWSSDSDYDLEQAYRLYLLAKAGKANVGAMNRLRLKNNTKVFSNWYLAGAYSIIGQSEVALELIKDNKDITKYGTVNNNHFGSQYRDKAIMLTVLSEMNVVGKSWGLVKEIAEKLNSKKYMSTQATAYCLLAMAKYVGENNLSNKLSFDIDMKTKHKISTQKSIWQTSTKYENLLPLKVNNTSKQPLFLNVIQEGVPTSQDTVNEQLGIQMHVVYKDENNTEIDPTILAQGTDFVAEVTVKNVGKKYYQHMSLSQVFPSGWEIHNNKMDNTSTWSNAVNYEDIRDDRVNLFYNLAINQTKTFKVFLNASYAGRYYLPTVQTEAMYDHEIRARKSGFWVQVVGE